MAPQSLLRGAKLKSLEETGRWCKWGKRANRRGLSWRVGATPPAMISRMKTLCDCHTKHIWRMDLTSRLQMCNLWSIPQVQAPAHSPGGLCDQAPDASQDSRHSVIRCCSYTRSMPTSFTIPCFCLRRSFTWNLCSPILSIIIFILLNPICFQYSSQVLSTTPGVLLSME